MIAITQNELELPRTPMALREWAIEKMAEIALMHGANSIRMATGLTKKLVEEAYPLGIFLCRRYWDSNGLMAHIVVGNQPYDAVILNHRNNLATKSYVEITQAHEGEDHHLRMLALSQEGRVNMLGRVTKTGTKTTGITVVVDNEAQPHSIVLATEITRIKAAINRKASKLYPPDTDLLVVLDDSIAFNHKREEDMEILHQELFGLQHSIRRFRSIALIGWSGRAWMQIEPSRERPLRANT